jgi:hypothetical protein
MKVTRIRNSKNYVSLEHLTRIRFVWKIKYLMTSWAGIRFGVSAFMKPVAHYNLDFFVKQLNKIWLIVMF